MRGTYFDTDKGNDPERDYLLLVEGVDDALFLEVNMSELKISPEKIQILVAGGKDKLPSLYRSTLRHHNYIIGKVKGYAILRDADDNPGAVVDEYIKLFASMGAPTPKPGEVIESGDKPSVGFFLFPKSGAAGDLETLCMEMISGGGLLEAASTFVGGAKESGGRQDHQTKRIMQAYLAVTSSPLCAGVGRATKNGQWDVKSDKLSELRQFVQALIK